MERPARVRIRSRKPWVFARRRVLGWNVRFMVWLLGTFDRGKQAVPAQYRWPCEHDRHRGTATAEAYVTGAHTVKPAASTRRPP